MPIADGRFKGISVPELPWQIIESEDCPKDTGYVICPEKITSPFASSMYPWMPDDASCNCKCPVLHPAEIMDFRCPCGHRFLATPKDVLRCASTGSSSHRTRS